MRRRLVDETNSLNEVKAKCEVLRPKWLEACYNTHERTMSKHFYMMDEHGQSIYEAGDGEVMLRALADGLTSHKYGQKHWLLNCEGQLREWHDRLGEHIYYMHGWII